jgi:alpha-L-rhamnosidase
LLSVLADNGHADLAYWMVEDTSYPSWGYMIEKGATTMWERWNGDVGDPSMNSYNHYAFGSVVEWLYRYAGGIDTAPDAPGFRKIVIRPRIDARLPHVHAEYDSLYGKIVTDWTWARSKPLSLNVTIPANTTATVYFPVEFNSKVTEGGKPIQVKKGQEGYATYEIGSGSYQFQVN